MNSTWGTVCDDMFDAKAASIVCAMAGYSRYVAVFLWIHSFSWIE